MKSTIKRSGKALTLLTPRGLFDEFGAGVPATDARAQARTARSLHHRPLGGARAGLGPAPQRQVAVRAVRPVPAHCSKICI